MTGVHREPPERGNPGETGTRHSSARVTARKWPAARRHGTSRRRGVRAPDGRRPRRSGLPVGLRGLRTISGETWGTGSPHQPSFSAAWCPARFDHVDAAEPAGGGWSGSRTPCAGRWRTPSRCTGESLRGWGAAALSPGRARSEERHDRYHRESTSHRGHLHQFGLESPHQLAPVSYWDPAYGVEQEPAQEFSRDPAPAMASVAAARGARPPGPRRTPVLGGRRAARAASPGADRERPAARARRGGRRSRRRGGDPRRGGAGRRASGAGGPRAGPTRAPSPARAGAPSPASATLTMPHGGR